MTGPPAEAGSAASATDVRGDPLLQERWYHTIELAPGVFTKGRDFRNLHLTRSLLQACEVHGARCLDVGTMDGLVPVLLARRGAARIVAHDLQRREERIALVKRALGVEFDYVPGLPLARLPVAARDLGAFPFDVVVFSGVLYHLLDPLSGLAIVRSMLRRGGLLVLETAAVVDRTVAAYFNAEGRFFEGTNYWQVSLECLDYLLRYLRLAPIDCAAFLHPRSKLAPLPICRVAVACRAAADVLAAPADDWMVRHGTSLQLDELVAWDELEVDAEEVAYAPRRGPRIRREPVGTLNLYETVRARLGRVDDIPEDALRLGLGAVV